jgi:hypothetical protein
MLDIQKPITIVNYSLLVPLISKGNSKTGTTFSSSGPCLQSAEQQVQAGRSTHVHTFSTRKSDGVGQLCSDQIKRSCGTF